MWERATRPLGFCIKPQFVPADSHPSALPRFVSPCYASPCYASPRFVSGYAFRHTANAATLIAPSGAAESEADILPA
jgi:hypothetical protein